MKEILINVLGGVFASVILIVAGAAVVRWYAPKRRELLRVYEECARKVLNISRQQAREIFRDNDVQRQLLNPIVGLQQEWAVLVDELKQRGVAEETLPSPIPFYQELVTELELSNHWQERGRTLTEQLRALLEKPALEAAQSAPTSRGLQAPKVSPPTGTGTLLFTDIQDSSQHWARLQQKFQPIKDRHDALLRKISEQWNGYEVQTIGDGFFFVFSKPSDAVQFAIATQLALTKESWGDDLNELRLRIGMHTGEPLLNEEGGRLNYHGHAVNLAARVMSAGHGGQILVSNATCELTRSGLPADITFRDLRTQRLKGVGEERIWQVCHPDLLQDFPPLNTLSAKRHNLPTPATPFIGRELEIAEWRELLLQPTTRLLTLTGFGGIGKTRSALQLAELCADEFNDGLWWVEVEEARTVEAMIERIAYQLRFHPQPPPSAGEQLLNYLREKQLLLVLDNTEQIPDAGEVISELLDAAPNLKCLVTTRRALGLHAERLVNVQPLPSSDAERLFEERARTRQSDFALTADNKGDAAELCRRLEYVPLAIELSASRIGSMTPREILSRLDERFRVLQTRAPDLPARQRALRGAIDWSYDLLTDEDKSLFAQLSVFAGGFTLDDAESVCDVPDVFEGLAELRRHSMLLAETDSATQRTRFFMLESLREYAAERLGNWEIGKSNEVRRRHAEHFLRFAEGRVRLMRTQEEARALDELGDTLDNLRAVMNWTHQFVVSASRPVGTTEAQRSGVEAAWCARLALALYHVLYTGGFWAEAQQCLQTGGDSIVGADTEVCPNARTLQAEIGYHLASLAHDRGDLAEARKQAETSLALRRESNDPLGIAESLNLLGLLAMDEGNTDAAQQFLEDAFRLLPHNDHTRRGKVLHNLARLATRRGDVARARRLYQRSLTHRQAAGDARGGAETLSNLGALAQRIGSDLEARRLYRNSLALYRVIGDRHGIAVTLNNLGEVADLAGEVETAIVLFVHAERIFRDLQSAFAAAPAESLQRLAEDLGAARFAALREAAEQTAWEEVVERGAPKN